MAACPTFRNSVAAFYRMRRCRNAPGGRPGLILRVGLLAAPDEVGNELQMEPDGLNIVVVEAVRDRVESRCPGRMLSQECLDFASRGDSPRGQELHHCRRFGWQIPGDSGELTIVPIGLIVIDFLRETVHR